MRRPRCGTEQKESPRREAGNRNRDGRTRENRSTTRFCEQKWIYI